jgi:lipid-binding SYLF domain-containing protein
MLKHRFIADDNSLEVIMQRRDFMLATASVAAAGLTLAACTTTPPSDTAAADKRRREIDTACDATLARLYSTVKDSRELVGKSFGVLIFPRVIAAGFVVGGQYGEGELRVRNAPISYYSLTSASIGLQIGAQSKSIIFLFLTQDSLDKFRKSKGWAVGVDASVAVLKAGANGMVDTTSVTEPVAAFVLTNAGLMANLSLEGTKISPLNI